MLGRTTGETDTINGAATVVSGVVPDAIGRMTAATVAGTVSKWSYDNNGNLATPTVTGANRTYTYSTSSPNELVSMATSGGPTLQYAYDNDGHPTVITTDASTNGVCTNSGQPSDGNTTCLRYDAAGRLYQAWMGAQNLIVTLGYTPQGQRSSYQVADSQQHPQYGFAYTYQGSRLVGVVRTSGIGGSQYQEQILYRPDGAPLELIYVPRFSTQSPCASQQVCRYWYETNGHGDVVALTDASGSVVNRYHYDLWGVPTTDQQTVEQPLRYAGYVYDSELRDPTQLGPSGIGWYWLGVRSYDPRLERFLQPDPSAQEGVRTYAYCNDDPLDCTDPTGLLSWGDIGNAIYNVAVGTAAVYDSLTFGGFSKLAGALGAPVPTNSAAYHVGEIAALPINLALAAVTGGTDVEADAAVVADLAGTAVRESEAAITIYRGTRIGTELEVQRDSGYLLSDAARQAYLESRLAGGGVVDALQAARSASEAAHARALEIWGPENEYAQAHAAFSSEYTAAFGSRSLISFTTDPLVARGFAGNAGYIFSATVRLGDLIPQTLPGAGESEVLVRHLIKASLYEEPLL